ncbi:MAG: osmoprotectant NAGGN system M42 family peptidase [Kiloniellales bacterium]
MSGARAKAKRPAIEVDLDYIRDVMLRLMEIPSPTGYTDLIVHAACDELENLEVEHELTRRGAIRATLKGNRASPDRAVVAHLDTLGAMVKGLKANGRLAVVPIGTWSARFAEGARVTVFTDAGTRRGTILPLKASGHTFGDEVDSQPIGWDHIELRVDEICYSRADLETLGFAVGDFVAVDPQAELTPAGFVASRHLDNKAGVAALFGAIKATKDAGLELPVDCHPLFTIAEETGSGASAVLHQDVAEMVAIDTAPQAPGQESQETAVTIGIKDSSGPFDWHLTQHLLSLAEDLKIPHRRDVMIHYRCDAAAALEAGNDIRTGLVCFGTDATHGYERTHLSALEGVARLLAAYMTSPPVVARDRERLASPKGFPKQPAEEAEEHLEPPKAAE